ncbi:alpha/beta hydrolase [Virgibacillus siamensis]|uniref:alpha/beta hydrolase n=1 Tax=Virgibacillus siamensis TaxID=480071 RepID=UPI00158EC2C7|nr:alpha/beta hydrolase [Virgibacillus siamensis]
MPYLKRKNVSIHYEKLWSENSYAGETIILVHGLGPDMNSWRFILPGFLQHYHVFLYDIRGFGESEAGDEPLTLDLLADDLDFLIREFNIGPYHLITQGVSGFVGVKHAGRQHEGNLRTLTLMTAPVYFPKKLGNKIIQQRRDWVEEAGSLYPLAKSIITQNCYPLTEEKASILFQAYAKVTPDVYFQLFVNHFEDNAAEQLGKVNVPTLLLSGAEDDVYPPELFAASTHLYPDARHFIVPNAAFMMQMDQPKLVSAWVHQFIEKATDKRTHPDNTYRRTLNSEIYREINDMHVSDAPINLHVNIMNGFSVLLNEKRIDGQWGKRKAKQLLVYLALKQSATRDELCDTFWPDTDLKGAKNSLRVALHHLKKTLETTTNRAVLSGDKEYIYLRGDIHSDLHQYMEKIKHAHEMENDVARAASYEQLLRNAMDNPIPGLYDEWFMELRDHLENEQGTMALFLADFYEKTNDRTACMNYMRMAVRYYQYDVHLQDRLAALEERLRSG